jgi:hypothetical protein
VKIVLTSAVRYILIKAVRMLAKVPVCSDSASGIHEMASLGREDAFRGRENVWRP